MAAKARPRIRNAASILFAISIKSVIINQGNVEAFQEYFNQLSDEDTFNKLAQLVGYNMNPELIDAIEIAAPSEKDKFMSYIVTNETTAAAHRKSQNHFHYYKCFEKYQMLSVFF